MEDALKRLRLANELFELKSDESNEELMLKISKMSTTAMALYVAHCKSILGVINDVIAKLEKDGLVLYPMSDAEKLKRYTKYILNTKKGQTMEEAIKADAICRDWNEW